MNVKRAEEGVCGCDVRRDALGDAVEGVEPHHTGEPQLVDAPVARRTFLKLAGFCLSMAMAAIVVGLIVAKAREKTIRGIRDLAGLWPVGQRQSERHRLVQRHDRAKRKRVARLARAIYNNARLCLSRRSKVMHWPTIHLFKIRWTFNPRHLQTLEFKTWETEVFPTCQKGLARKAARVHFNRAKEGVIREHLALAAIQVYGHRPEFQPTDLDKALGILKPLLDDDHRHCDWRIYELYGRLVCFKEKDPKLAYKTALKDLWGNHFAGDGLGKGAAAPSPRLPWLGSEAAFEAWHRRTVAPGERARFRERFLKRVDCAHVLVEGLSSSGKDTSCRGKSRSNRLRPSSRSRRRVRGDSVWERVKSLFGPRNPKTRRNVKTKICAPSRELPCLPVVRKNRLRYKNSATHQ